MKAKFGDVYQIKREDGSVSLAVMVIAKSEQYGHDAPHSVVVRGEATIKRPGYIACWRITEKAWEKVG